MKRVASLLCCFCVLLPSFARAASKPIAEPPPRSIPEMIYEIRVEGPYDHLPLEWNVPRENVEVRIFDKRFWFRAAMLSAATVLDIESTRRGLDQCERCEEANPLFGSAVADGDWDVVYLAQFGINTGVMWWAQHARKKTPHGWTRLPDAFAASHALVGVHNVRQAERFGD